MRDFSSIKNSLESQVEKICLNWVSEREQNLRRAVSDSSNFHVEDETFFRIKHLKLTELIKLSIVSWYCPEEIRFILQLDIERVSKNLSMEDRLLLKQFLSSKNKMLIFLNETSLWHSREFFGNILSPNRNPLSSLKLPLRAWMRKKAKFPQRKRGYRDKGSRVPVHSENPNKQINDTLALREYYNRKKQEKDTQAFIEGMLW